MAGTSYTVEWENNTGLHPRLHITHPSASTSCSLFSLISLPNSLIADRFQLAQLHHEGHLGSFDSTLSIPTLIITGERDIEVPVSRAKSAFVLMRLNKEEKKTEVPLHARYLKPVEKRWKGKERMDRIDVEMEWPSIFYSCRDDVEPPPHTIPCLSSHLSGGPYPSLPPTIHLLPLHSTTTATCPPHQSLPILSLSLPTGVLDDLQMVQMANLGLVWLGMAWVLRAVWMKRREMKGVAKSKVAKVD